MKAELIYVNRKYGHETWGITCDNGTGYLYSRRALETMPLDRFDQGVGFVHATGYDYRIPSDGTWRTEYEDTPEYQAICEAEES